MPFGVQVKRIRVTGARRIRPPGHVGPLKKGGVQLPWKVVPYKTLDFMLQLYLFGRTSPFSFGSGWRGRDRLERSSRARCEPLPFAPVPPPAPLPSPVREKVACSEPSVCGWSKQWSLLSSAPVPPPALAASPVRRETTGYEPFERARESGRHTLYPSPHFRHLLRQHRPAIEAPLLGPATGARLCIPVHPCV